jgi:hypothetical protein
MHNKLCVYNIMTRKYKKTKRRRRRRTRPLVSQSARQVVVVNPPAQRRKKKSGRKKRGVVQKVDPFIAAQFIPERRHYFRGNQRFADNLQSKYDQLLIENKIKGQYANLEKKLESFGQLNRTVSDNQRQIRSLMGELRDTEATPRRRRGLSLSEEFGTEGRGVSRTRQTARSRSISPARPRNRRPTRDQPTTLERAAARLPNLSSLVGASAAAIAAGTAGYFAQPVGTGVT